MAAIVTTSRKPVLLQKKGLVGPVRYENYTSLGAGSTGLSLPIYTR